jgi:hypothetical protein
LNLDLKATMQEIFDHHTPPNRGGVVRGGDGKLICLAGNPLSSVTLRNLVRTPCSSIIEDTRSLFHDFYLHIPQIAEFSSAGESEIQAIRERDPRVQSALKKLSSSGELLAIMDKHLASTWDVDDDGSLDLSYPHEDSSVSRNRRKRKAGDSNDSMRHIHLRRMGRMPPSFTERSRNAFPSQITRASSDEENLFSNSSGLHSSSGAPSSSNPRSRNDGPSAK